MATVKILESNFNFFAIPASGTNDLNHGDFMHWYNDVGGVSHGHWIWVAPSPNFDLVKTIAVQTDDADGGGGGDPNAPTIQITGLSFVRNADYWNAIKASGNLGSLVADLLAGDDIIFGNDSSETLLGYDGNDILIGDGGGDELYGSFGTNTASYQTAPGGVKASLANPASNTGDAAGDQYFSIQNLIGSTFNDTLEGDDNPNRLTGGLGRDKLRGFDGPDIFDFNAIKETKKGSGRDKILDFDRAAPDRIDLSTIDAKSASGDQAFKFIGKRGFHDKEGELRYKDKGATCIVQGDVNGDGKPDFEIFVHAGSLSKGDFIL